MVAKKKPKHFSVIGLEKSRIKKRIRSANYIDLSAYYVLGKYLKKKKSCLQ